MRKGAVLVAAIVAAAAMPAAAAAADDVVLRTDPIELGPYEVGLDEVTFDVPVPQRDGFITSMSADVVDERGRPVPVTRTMLHHAVFANTGARLGERRDATCDRFTLWDGESQLPTLGERFMAVGEERNRLDLPAGYGYPIARDDRWAMSIMLMNHRNRPDKVRVQYRMAIESAKPLKPVRMWWLDIRDCRLDPVFDVDGGGRRGSTERFSVDYVAPESGRLVFGIGHIHGGGRDVSLRSVTCGNRELFTSRPLWGKSDHPYYKVRPVLHEPGPISMEAFQSGQGIPVAKGERLRLTATYDNELPHPRAMGILPVGFAPDASVKAPCGPLPADTRRYWTADGGRVRAPRMKVPINHLPFGTLGSGRRAREVSRPPGTPVVARSGSSVDVGAPAFAPTNLVVRKGATVNWRFEGETLHSVTLANGPRGFSSPTLNRERTYAHRFSRPGTYRVYCALHPVTMTGTVTVRGRR